VIEEEKMEEFDLIVIGGGSGADVASWAAEEGLRAAIVENGPMGGTCLNRGCIPSKMLIHSADVVETIKRAHLFGIKSKGYTVDFPSIVNRVSDTVDRESRQIEEALRNSTNPKFYKEQCKFTGPKTLQVGQDSIKGKKVVIASGGRPKVPRIEGLDQAGYITSDQALRLKKQPKVLTIIGGGYIAVELAHFFGALGTAINIVQRRDVLIPNEDWEIAQKFTEIFEIKFNVMTGYEPLRVSKKDSTFLVEVESTGGKSKRELKSDQLLIASGREPNSDKLDLEKTGVKTDEKGFIVTNEYMETNVDGIYALGDAVGHYLFKHSANLEAQYDFLNLLNPDEKTPVDYSAMPHAIFSSPQVAGVGSTEQKLKEEKIDYIVGKYNYIDTAMGEAIEEREGFVKILADSKSRKILGCHIMGYDASTLIHEALVAMRCGEGTLSNINRVVHIHPALSEVVQRAAASARESRLDAG
jgi:mycothione reductase